MRSGWLRLVLVTHRQEMPLPAYVDFIKRCASAGVTAVQLREKHGTREGLIEFACALKEILNPLSIPLIINDDVVVAKEVGACGVHLGQSDQSPTFAREALGPNTIVGLSIEHEHDLDSANRTSLDYVAASAVFPSSHKHNLKTIWGLKGLAMLAKNSCHPVIAIGGIDHSNAREVICAGASGIAVIGAIHGAHDPEASTRALRKIIDDAVEGKNVNRT